MDTEDGRWTCTELQVRIVSLVQTVVLSGPVYTKRQCQRCNNSAMTLEILFSLKTMESLKNGLQPQSEVTSLFSVRTASLV